MKITAIKQQVKNSVRASIFVDGKYSFSLSLNELVAEKLKLNQDVDQPALKRLKKLSEDGKLKNRALEWVLNRPRSTRELRDYLYRKQVDADQLASLVEFFTGKGYVDDQKFADWLVDLRKRAGKSDRVIQGELYKKGISREIVASTNIDSGLSNLDRLRQLIDKKQKLTRYKNDEQKFKMYLLRQGFSYDDIKQALSSNDF